MSLEYVLISLSIVISIIAGIVQIIDMMMKGFKLKKMGELEVAPGERIQASINNLRKASDEANLLFQEIVADLSKRERALTELEAKNKELAVQEEGLRKRIDSLKEIPIEVAEYFHKINQQTLEQMEKRSGRRDVLFFVLGILASVMISVILRISGYG